MERRVRVDFIEHPAGDGYFVAVNGRRVDDRFANAGEVVAFAQALGATAYYSGTGGPLEGTTPSQSGGSGDHA